MRITGRQIRQIIREELSRLQESRRGDEEGSGYEYIRKMPSTIDWVDGPVDDEWVSNTRAAIAACHPTCCNWSPKTSRRCWPVEATERSSRSTATQTARRT